MSKKLPLEIRRNFTAKDQGTHWELTCDVCKENSILEKPGKGKTISAKNISLFVEHAASHPLPSEEEVPASEPIVELVSDPAPVSHVEQHIPPTLPKYSYPSVKHPNAYKVEVKGRSVEVSKFRDLYSKEYLQVQKTATGYYITLFAANPKHANLIGQRLIERHCNERPA